MQAIDIVGHVLASARERLCDIRRKKLRSMVEDIRPLAIPGLGTGPARLRGSPT